ncbi:MAG: type II secretion system GspH family protein [Eubacterium sp.]|nr:type II secretion system GspH family protein [Eubacterium sp.]
MSKKRLFNNIYLNNRCHKGFSLVELIIVIAIMAILASVVTPSIIRFIVKARKADDIVAAETLGTTFMAAISEDEEMYEYVTTMAGDLPRGRDYKVIASCNPTGRYYQKFKLVGLNYRPTSIRHIDVNIFEEKFNSYLGAADAPMKFTSQNYLDQWLIAVDKNCNVSVWAAGGFNSNDSWIQTDGRIFNNHGRAYMLWPTVDPEYNELSTPPKSYN